MEGSSRNMAAMAYAMPNPIIAASRAEILQQLAQDDGLAMQAKEGYVKAGTMGPERPP